MVIIVLSWGIKWLYCNPNQLSLLPYRNTHVFYCSHWWNSNGFLTVSCPTAATFFLYADFGRCSRCKNGGMTTSYIFLIGKHSGEKKAVQKAKIPSSAQLAQKCTELWMVTQAILFVIVKQMTPVGTFFHVVKSFIWGTTNVSSATCIFKIFLSYRKNGFQADNAWSAGPTQFKTISHTGK